MVLSFGQITYSLQIVKRTTVNSAKTLAQALGHSWPPPNPSLRSLLSEAMSAVRGPSGFMNVTSVPPPDEPFPPITANTLSAGSGYVFPPAGELVEAVPPGTVGTFRLTKMLRDTAQIRDGNAILRKVADTFISNSQNTTTVSQVMLTAMTQLAATGSNAFAAWQANPTQEQDLTSYLKQNGMDPATATTTSQKIMADFNAARTAVRNSRAGIDAASLRAGIGPAGAAPSSAGWIAVSAEDDPPDYPVNVQICNPPTNALYPQFHVTLVVDSLRVDMRYVIASSQGQNWQEPEIPRGNDVILFLPGEGSRAEEALDLIPALHAAATAAGRNITVVALDLPGSGYTTRLKWELFPPAPDSSGIWRWIRDTPPHTEVAPMPDMSTAGGFVELPPYVSGSPLADFVEHTISAFTENVILPFGNPVKAVVGGSLGGHMALRFASSQTAWVNNVVAWSPASVWEHDFKLLGVSIAQRILTDPQTAAQVANPEASTSRAEFFHAVWEENVFPPDGFDPLTVAGALITAAIFPNAIVILGAAAIAAAILTLPTVPPQATMWYRDGWPSKPAFMDAARFDRIETYNVNLRQWHWRLAGELIDFQFDPASIQKPLLLIVGEEDNYPMVQFLDKVKEFAGELSGSGQALTVRDTGHSIASERPAFLAAQILRFAR